MLILASKSPRRQELLKMVGLDFKVIESHFDESQIHSDDLKKTPLIEAINKASMVAKLYPNDIVIGADTGVFIAHEMLGKPRDKKDATRMLKLLAAQTHEVITGVCIIKEGQQYLINSISKVTFYPLTEREIEDYVNSCEPYDKAGAYAIQGKGATLISHIEGDYFTIMGLPLAQVYRQLKQLL